MLFFLSRLHNTIPRLITNEVDPIGWTDFGVHHTSLSRRFLESLIVGAKPIGLAVALVAVASTSIWAAAWRVPGLDIIEILRAE